MTQSLHETIMELLGQQRITWDECFQKTRGTKRPSDTCRTGGQVRDFAPRSSGALPVCHCDHSVSSSLTATSCKAACVLTFASAVASTMPGVWQALEILKWVDLGLKNIKWQEKTCSGLDSLVR